MSWTAKVMESMTPRGKKSGKVEIYGVPGSMNAMGPVLLTLEHKLGEMKVAMPYQDTVTPEFLKINPFHAVPALKDGTFCLAESNAIMRYLGSRYVPALYPLASPEMRATVDWAMDRFSSALYPDAAKTIYAVFGYVAPPEDKEAAAKNCLANLEEYCGFFLSKGKFVGGDKLSIADYKIAPFFYCYAHPALELHAGVKCPQRVLTFVEDFMKACGASAMLESAGGYSLKEQMDSKMPKPDWQECVDHTLAITEEKN